MTYANIAEALLTKGYAKVRLAGPDRDSLVRLRASSASFFRQAEVVKRSHGSDDFNFGFRPYGRQFSVTPDRPDMCESFAYWSDDPSLIPNHHELGSFLTALRAYRASVGEITDDILAQLAAHYAYPAKLEVGPASYLEINWYMCDSDRELLQERHEDGHLLSYVTPDRAGLEIEVDGEMQAQDLREDELLIMPGSLLTSMTGGAVPPMYHQVRNYHLPDRLTVLYFVNTPMQGSVEPYVVTDQNRGLDMVKIVRANCTLYGKSEPPVLA